MSAPTPDLSAALSWLRALEPDGPWLLVAIDPDRTSSRPAAILAEYSPDAEVDLRKWLQNRSDDGYNLYYTSNLPQHAPFTTSKKEAIRFLRILHLDVDLPGSADDPDATAALLDRIREFDPPPTAIVFSGGGYQAIWKLAERLAAAENLDRIERVNVALWTALSADHCHDVSRLLRLPGTVNIPNATKRARGRVPSLSYLVEADWSRTWSLGNDRVPHIPDSDSVLPEASLSNRPSGAGNTGVFDDLPAALRRQIVTGDTTRFLKADGTPDRSTLLFVVISHLIRLGWSDDQIGAMILNRAYGISAHIYDNPNPRSEAARQIKRAHEKMAIDWNRSKTNAILPKDQANVDRALTTLGIALSYDALADKIWLNGAGPARPLTDPELDLTWLRVQQECGFLPDKPFFTTVLSTRARSRSYHPVLDYLAKVQPTWDQVPRIDTWLTRYGGAEDTSYVRAVGRLTLVAAVRRARHPGCKFDEMLMLVSEVQGNNKSTAVRTLAVRDEEWFNDHLPIGEAGREVIEHIRGFWIIEAQEMAGLTTRDLERVKGFCSRQTDRGRMAYDRLMSDVPRHCVFIGTTNETALFTDLVNRRFWPVLVEGFDIDALRRDLDQLWAEAAVAEAAGESIRLAQELWPVAAEVQSRFRVEDVWTAQLAAELRNLAGRITTVDLYKILNKATGTAVHTDGRRLAKAMREIGFDRVQIRDTLSWNNAPTWFYVRGTESERKRSIMVFRDPVTGILTIADQDEIAISIEPEIPL